MIHVIQVRWHGTVNSCPRAAGTGSSYRGMSVHRPQPRGGYRATGKKCVASSGHLTTSTLPREATTTRLSDFSITIITVSVEGFKVEVFDGHLPHRLCLQLLVWNSSSLVPMQQYSEHLAAVKAIAWSPHQHGLLASGGGTADRCLRFWNTLTGQALQSTDTGSQVCNLAWSKHANELVRDTLTPSIQMHYVYSSCCCLSCAEHHG